MSVQKTGPGSLDHSRPDTTLFNLLFGVHFFASQSFYGTRKHEYEYEIRQCIECAPLSRTRNSRSPRQIAWLTELVDCIYRSLVLSRHANSRSTTVKAPGALSLSPIISAIVRIVNHANGHWFGCILFFFCCKMLPVI